MQMLSDDDRNLAELSNEELVLAWDLWFDLAQATNDADPPYSHGVFAGLAPEPDGARGAPEARGAPASSDSTDGDGRPD